jgi:hypothetical protein
MSRRTFKGNNIQQKCHVTGTKFKKPIKPQNTQKDHWAGFKNKYRIFPNPD